MCLYVGVLKRLEEEDLDEGVRRRLKDSSETPGALWHIYLNRDMVKVREFLHKVSCCCCCNENNNNNRSTNILLAKISLPFFCQPPQLCKEQGLDMSLDQDPIRDRLYLSRKQRQQLLDEHGVQGWTVVQFLGDSVLIPAGSMYQVCSVHT